FIEKKTVADRGLEVHSASVDASTGACLRGEEVLITPAALDSRVVVDAGLRYFYYTVNRANALPAVVVQEIDWERSRDGRVRALQKQTLTTIADPEAVAAVRDAAGAERAAVVPAWWVPGGRMVNVRDKWWRLVGAQAQRLPVPPDAADLAPLLAAPPGSPCAKLAGLYTTAPGFHVGAFEHGDHCFRVARGWPQTGAGDEALRPERDELRVSVHERPLPAALERAAGRPPAPLAGLVPFARVVQGGPAGDAMQGYVGTSGPYAGWLLMKSVSRRGEDRYFGMPWSTCALWRLGRDLQGRNPAPGTAQAGAAPVCRAG
ncbi:MAG TPA: hypothetical protein VLM87_08770, partial [Rubrivivax sp.]|nr:hypothetical protein [Rubrivivax sp.]